MPEAMDVDIDNSSSTDGSIDSINNRLLALYSSMVRRSAWIQENAQMQQDVPRPERFEIVPPLLTNKQRREYVRYKEDNKGNLI